MKNNRTNRRVDMEREIEKVVTELGTMRSRKKTSGTLWSIIFWVAVIAGAIALYELLR